MSENTEVNAAVLRDRCLELATKVAAPTVGGLVRNAEAIREYIINGNLPVAEVTTLDTEL